MRVLKQRNRSPMGIWLLSTALVGLFTISGNAHAALTPAGGVIKSQSTATYTDASGTSYLTQSNLAEVSVQQVYFSALDLDRTQNIAAGSIVYFPHSLTNNGNGTDIYAISIADKIGEESGDNADFLSGTLKVYEDINGNGVLDAGEGLVQLTSKQLDAGQSVSIIVQGSVSSTLKPGEKIMATLTTTPSTAGLAGGDTAKTNKDTATVVTGAIVQINQSAVHDSENRKITYRIAVKNNGTSEAKNVLIYNALPAGTELVIADAEKPTYTGSSAFPGTGGYGLYFDQEKFLIESNTNESKVALNFNGDGDTTDTTEAEYGLDLDSSGTVDAETKKGVFVYADKIPVGTTYQVLTFTVQYPEGSKGNFKNTSYVSADTDETTGSDVVVASNQFIVTTIENVNGTIVDTDLLGTADLENAVNDGKDDDATVNAIQLVGAAPVGSAVLFKAKIKNTGNVSQEFEVVVTDPDFPDGTTFQLWNETGTTLLIDSDGDGISNTFPMGAGETSTILIKAIIPSLVSDTDIARADLPTPNPFDATVTLYPKASGTDPLGSPLTLTLNKILAASVDLANGTAADNNTTLNKDEFKAGPLKASEVKKATVGTAFTYDIVIENDGASADSFQLDAGGKYSSANGIGALFPGWSVKFYDSNNNQITTTKTIPARSETVITVEVTPSADPSQALPGFKPSDNDWDTNGSGGVDTNDDLKVGTDVLDLTDVDAYPIFLSATSSNTGAKDILLNAVDVGAFETVDLLEDRSGQTTKGSTIAYSHRLINKGNKDQNFSLSVVNDQDGWSSVVMIDTDDVDEELNTSFDTLVAVTGEEKGKVAVRDITGAKVFRDVVVEVVNGVAQPKVTLKSGDKLDLLVLVSVPATAAFNQFNITTLTASYVNAASTTINITNVDQTTVTSGNVTLVKTSALDAKCDNAGAPDTNTTFTTTDNAGKPGDCIIWQLVLSNRGADDVKDIAVNDLVPTYTKMVQNSAKICLGDAGTTHIAACTLATAGPELEVSNDAVAGYHSSNSTLEFDLNNWTDTTWVETETKSLKPNKSVTIRFSTKID